MGYLQTSRAYKGFHYSVLSKESLDYLHRRTLEMADEIVKIFEENGIRYSICGGTLLGAVTTGKVIPWDDDFDMCVLEEDYEKARQLLLERGVKGAIVQCESTEPKYFHGWTKIRDLKSSVGPDKDGYANTGVWVDMYKLHRIKKNAIEWFVCKEHIAYLWCRFCRAGLGSIEFVKRFFKANLLNKVIISLIKQIIRRGGASILSARHPRLSLPNRMSYPCANIRWKGELIMASVMPKAISSTITGKVIIPCRRMNFAESVLTKFKSNNFVCNNFSFHQAVVSDSLLMAA